MLAAVGLFLSAGFASRGLWDGAESNRLSVEAAKDVIDNQRAEFNVRRSALGETYNLAARAIKTLAQSAEDPELAKYGRLYLGSLKQQIDKAHEAVQADAK